MLLTLRKIFYIVWHKDLFELLGKLDFVRIKPEVIMWTNRLHTDRK